jgi:hypothetical protein
VREDGGVAELGGRCRVGDGYWRGKGADQVA